MTAARYPFILLLLLALLPVLQGKTFFPCHPSKATPNNDVLCTRVVLPPRLCKSCPLRPTDSEGSFVDCQRIFDTSSDQCHDALQEYVDLNECDHVRRDALQGLKEGNEDATTVMDYFLYSLCEQCCDCVPMGTKRTDYIALASAHKPDDPYLWDEARGNCPAHAQFDVCKVLPNVEYFTGPGGEEIEAVKACPLLRDWQNSDAATEWEINPETEISSRVRSFLRGMLNAIDCENFSIWTKCHDMEEKQNHLVVRDEFSGFKPDIPDVDTDSSNPPETTVDDDGDTDASAEDENEDENKDDGDKSDEDKSDEDKSDEDKSDEDQKNEDKSDEDQKNEDKSDEDKKNEDKSDEDKDEGDTDDGDKDDGKKGDDENDNDDDKESDQGDDDDEKETHEDEASNEESDGKRPSDAQSAAIGNDGSQDDDNSGSESSTISGTSGTCFPGSSLAELQSGEMVRMDKLRIGDSVRVSKEEFSRVFMFTHRIAYPLQEFVEVHVGNRTLHVTEGHIVYANDIAVVAEKVRVGDMMKTVEGDGVVHKVGRVMDRGLYNPQTLQGNIVVDGVGVSTYTMAVDRFTATALMAPIRGLFRRGWIGERLVGGWFREGYRSIIPM